LLHLINQILGDKKFNDEIGERRNNIEKKTKVQNLTQLQQMMKRIVLTK